MERLQFYRRSSSLTEQSSADSSIVDNVVPPNICEVRLQKFMPTPPYRMVQIYRGAVRVKMRREQDRGAVNSKLTVLGNQYAVPELHEEEDRQDHIHHGKTRY